MLSPGKTRQVLIVMDHDCSRLFEANAAGSVGGEVQRRPSRICPARKSPTDKKASRRFRWRIVRLSGAFCTKVIVVWNTLFREIGKLAWASISVFY